MGVILGLDGPVVLLPARAAALLARPLDCLVADAGHDVWPSNRGCSKLHGRVFERVGVVVMGPFVKPEPELERGETCPANGHCFYRLATRLRPACNRDVGS